MTTNVPWSEAGAAVATKQNSNAASTLFVVEQSFKLRRGRREHRISHYAETFAEAQSFMATCREDPETTRLRLMVQTTLLEETP